jgi:hypothetical protein
MSDVKLKYGTANQAITITLTSLANNAARASTAVDNTSNLHQDVQVQVQVKTGASSTSSNGFVNVYAYGTSAATYPEGISGTDAALTMTVPPNLVLIGQINAVANATTYTSEPFSVAQAFGGYLPALWGIVVENRSGATLDASVGSAWYRGINSQVV